MIMKKIKLLFQLIITVSIISLAGCDKEPAFTCSDGVQNGTEIGVDCGGECIICSTCNDNVQNGIETGVDCGGVCDACPTCSDNVMNGTETGIDCGGSCDPCLDLEAMLLGLWEFTDFRSNGEDVFKLLGFEAVYYKFNMNGQLESFNHRTNNQNNLSFSTYVVDNTVGSVTVFLGNSTITYNVTFSLNDTRINLQQIDKDVAVTAMRIPDNLCQGIDCNDGGCVYGYCECPNGVTGESCEVKYGPSGGIVIYDKGSFSNGWQYIEVHTTLFSDKSVGCNGLEGNSSFNSIGAGASNTIGIDIICQNVSGHAARAALNFSINGYDDWYLPSLDELRAVAPFQKYFIDFDGLNPYRDLQTSSFVNKQSWVVRFKPEGFEWFQTSALVGRGFLVVRYY